LPSPIHAKFSDPRKLRKALCERDFNSYTLKIHPHDLQMSLFFKGTNGRWQEVLTEEEVALYDQAAKRELTHDCRQWLENGRLYMTQG
jgi:hypothetical protein